MDIMDEQILKGMVEAILFASGDPVSGERIAQVLGLSRWAVNQAINNMKARGWLATRYGRVIIRDMDALLNFSADEPNS